MKFNKAKSGSDDDKLEFCNQYWAKLNKQKFSGKLKRPLLYLMKNMGRNFNGHGVWYPVQRRLGINRRIFNSTQDHFIQLLLHEMCHQAVSEIDKALRHSHGYLWQAWMRKVGLEANRLATRSEHDSLLTQDELNEREEKRKKRASLTKTQEHYYGGGDKGDAVKFVINGEWIYGRIAHRMTQKYAIAYETSARWYTIQFGNLYQCSKAEEKKVKKQVSMETVERISEYLTEKKERRQTRRQMRNILGY